jgi:GNAT superfamily N-acetyltransferase
MPDDYPAFVAIRDAVYPDLPRTVEELRYEDEHQSPQCKFQRWVAERDGRVVGVGQYSQSAHHFHPRKFNVRLEVLPAFQGRGIGADLDRQVMEALQTFDPLSVLAVAREDKTRSVRFLQDRKYEELERFWESRLDVTTFDFAPYNGVEESALAQGITINTLKELASDPDYQRKVYEVSRAAEEGEPSAEPITPVSYEFFVEQILSNPNFLPEACFIAVHNGEYVGISNLETRQGDPHMLDTGFTGVTPAYRRKGIALALKLRAVAYAKEKGVPVIKTDNHSLNRPMLSINERLGFVKQPAWIHFVKRLKEED